MIPYEDLERALARWKARGHTPATEAAAPDASADHEGGGGEVAADEDVRESVSGLIDLNEISDQDGEA